VVSSFEHGNEPSGSIKGREFLDQLSILLASQEGLCSMELVNSFSIGPGFESRVCDWLCSAVRGFPQ
jgi:hypothetical protein